MRNVLIILSLFLLFSPLFGQSERPESIVIPVSSVGDVSNTRKLILQNALEEELKTHSVWFLNRNMKQFRKKCLKSWSDKQRCFRSSLSFELEKTRKKRG